MVYAFLVDFSIAYGSVTQLLASGASIYLLTEICGVPQSGSTLLRPWVGSETVVCLRVGRPATVCFVCVWTVRIYLHFQRLIRLIRSLNESETLTQVDARETFGLGARWRHLVVRSLVASLSSRD